MKGTTATRIGRAIKYGLKRPTHFLRAFRHFPLWGKSPIELSLPWISYGAIDWLERNLTPSMEVLEFGSGGSTFFFAQRTNRVYSKESHSTWFTVVENSLREKRISNVELELAELDEDPSADFHQHPFFSIPQDRQFDVVLVDGFCGFQVEAGHAYRNLSLQRAVLAIRPGGFILLDDSWLYPELLQEYCGNLVANFISFGPCRYGVTSTALFRF